MSHNKRQQNRTMSPSFLHLNNQGVIHLIDGHYEEASKLFRISFKMMKDVITRHGGEPPDEADDTAFRFSDTPTKADDSSVSTLEGPSSLVIETGVPDEACDRAFTTGGRTTKRKLARQQNHEHETNFASAKRQRIDQCEGRLGDKLQERVCTNVHGNLCRPLWLQPGNTSRKDLATFAPSILYNYAFSLHRMGTEEQRDRSSETSQTCEHYRRKATSVYTKVFQLCGKRRCPLVKWMCCHNLQHLTRMILAEETDYDMVRKLALRFRNLETHKVLILRARFSAKAGEGSDQLFLSVLSLLGGEGRAYSAAEAA